MAHAKRNKAIIIAPDYPLGPEGTYQDINDALRDFLLWYKQDLFLETPKQPFQKWTDWISKVANIGRIDPSSSPIFIEGESAGGHAAVTTAFLNAAKTDGVKLPIRVALLRYPMIAHYTRTYTEGADFMRNVTNLQDTKAQESLVEKEIQLLEKHGLVPTRVKGYAPDKMAGAFLLSMMGRWTAMFKRAHDLDVGAVEELIVWPTNKNVEHTWDCIERAEASVEDVDHSVLPVMLMYHGRNDVNCPIDDTLKFVNALKTKYPTRYNAETVQLQAVLTLSGQEKPEGQRNAVTSVGHGFDYDIREEHETFLKEIYAKVDEQWKAK